MSRTKHTIVTIVGNIASGKSTALPIIVKKLQAIPLNADNLFQTRNPFAKRYLADIKRWAFVNELWMTTERMKLLRDHAERIKKGVTVVDSGLLMSWVYTYGHYRNNNITTHEWKLYQNIYSHFTKFLLTDSCVIFLRYPIKTLLKRIKKRGRAFELTYYTPKYLRIIDDGLIGLQNYLSAHAVSRLIIKEVDVPDFENCEKDRTMFLNKVTDFIRYV